MIFIADEDALNSKIQMLSKSYFRVFMNGLFLLLFILALIIARKLYYDFWLIPMAIFAFSAISLVPYLSACKKLNRFVKTIEIDKPLSKLTTQQVPLFGGITKLSSKKITARELLLKSISEGDKKFASFFNSDIFTFFISKEKYFIVEDYYRDFVAIKKLLA
jgi:hypothetical protein